MAVADYRVGREALSPLARRLWSRFQRLLEISNVERRLLLRAFVTVGATRLTLTTLGTREARRIASVSALGVFQARIDRVAWAVRVAGAHLPAATCLTQAIALQAMLERTGYHSSIEIGVTTNGGLNAHAWVVADGRIVIGGDNAGQYASLGRLD
jgi:hypothetical protein